MAQMKNEGWSIVRVLCTDGEERVGICEDWDANPLRTYMSGLTMEYAHALHKEVARENGLKPFDGSDSDYQATFDY